MPRKKKVGRPKGRKKDKLLSVRVSGEMWSLLAQVAGKNKRSLSREVEARLDYTLGRYQKGAPAGYELPPHLRPLVDVFAFSARYIEAQFGRRWHESKFTSRELARAIGQVMVEFSAGTDMPPSKIVERAKTHPIGEKAYLAHPGDEEAHAIIMQLRIARAPEELKGMLFSEWEHELWKLRRDLEQLERKKRQ
jgi:hypothetical protein